MLVQLIEEPYATMVYVAVYTGLRVSEVIALRWSDIHEQSITIDERYCRGSVRGQWCLYWLTFAGSRRRLAW